MDRNEIEPLSPSDRIAVFNGLMRVIRNRLTQGYSDVTVQIAKVQEWLDRMLRDEK
jgi:hypothetical protein